MRYKSYVFLLLLAVCLVSCNQHSRIVNDIYKHVEDIMPLHPDSALTLLSTIQDINVLSEKDRAMYYLLLTEAENKTYVKPSSDSLITIATEYFDKTEDWKRKAKAWYYKGRINQDLGDALHAQDYYLKALQDEDKVNDHALLGRIYSSVGMLYTYQEVYEKAIPYQKKALQSFHMIQDSIGQSYTLRDIGRTFTVLEMVDSAIVYYEKAVVFSGNRSKISIYRELGSLYMKKEDYQSSYKFLQYTLGLPLENLHFDPTYLILGRLFQKTGRVDSAYYYLNICSNSPLLETRVSAYYYLAQLAKDKKSWEDYAINQMQYEVLRDSISKKKQTESIRKMERLYDYHQTESKFLQTKILLDKMEINFLYMCLFGIVFAVCISAGGMFLYKVLRNRRNKILEQQEKLVALKRKREADQLRIDENQEKINHLEQLLRESSLAYSEKEKELMTLRKLKLEAENRTLACVKTERQLLVEKFCMSDIYYKFHIKEEWRPKDEDWDELFKAIDETYDNFTHRLMGVASKLTTTELRVSCLVKANVPPVIIAMLIVTTPTNVSMIRKRLYEKIYSVTGSTEKFDRFIREF